MPYSLKMPLKKRRKLQAEATKRYTNRSAMTDEAKKAAVQKFVGEMTPQFAAFLRTTSSFGEIFAGVGLNNLEAAAAIIVVKKIFGADMPDSVLVAFGIWLERRSKEKPVV